MLDQTQLVLGLLRDFMCRSFAENKRDGAAIFKLLRRIRIRQAERLWQEMERCGTKLGSAVDWKDIPF